MNRREPNVSNRQAGGYRSDENDAWDAPRQASQWQGDIDRQSGSWNVDENERTDYFGADRPLEGRYAGDPRDQGAEARYRDEARRGQGRERGYRGSGSGRGAYGERGDQAERGYRFSGSRGAPLSSHDFDASGGNDFRNFTSEDYGGRDYAAGRAGGVTGGMHPSDTYRPSFGPGSWSRGRDTDKRDYGGWREYGEERGFLARAGDEVASWFGDEDATRRREADHRGRGPSDYTRSDERIREDVNDTLTHDWRIDASHVRVNVKDGEVTLEGTVDSRQDKRRAEDLADDVSGVRHVQNNLRVKSTSAEARGTATSAGAGTAGSSATGTTSTTASRTS